MSELNPPDELPPDTFAPANPIIVEVLTPAVNTAQAAADLELLTQIICDRISQALNSRIENKSCHQSNRIFSSQAIATSQIEAVQKIALSSSTPEQAIDVIEKLAQEIDKLLHYRLVYERERRGSVGCLPW